MENVEVKYADLKFTTNSASCVSSVSFSAGGGTGSFNFGCTGQFGDVFLIDNSDLIPPPEDRPIIDVNICMHTITIPNDPQCSNQGCYDSDDSDMAGAFSINSCLPNNNYSFTAFKADEHLCGTTTFDLVLITKHILGIQPFDPTNEKWRYLAADVNNSNTITTLDLIILRKIILGIYDQFPQGSFPWMFVSDDFIWSDFTIPTSGAWDDSMISDCIENLQGLNCNLGFHAIKIGDVNRSCQSQGGNTPLPRLVIEVKDGGINPSGLYETKFVPLGFQDIVGLEMAMRPTASKLIFNDLLPRDLIYVDGDSHHEEDGTIRFAWYDETGVGKFLDGNEEMFNLQLQPVVPIGFGVEDITLDNTVIQARAYGSLGKEYEVVLAYENSGSSLQKPNTGRTEHLLSIYDKAGSPAVEANALESQQTILTIYDIQGKKLYQQHVELNRGLNVIKPNLPNNWPAGLYVFHLQTSEQPMVGKWIKQ